MSGKKVEVLTQNAPSPIGPYSQAIRVGDWVYCSGQIPINPQNGQIEATTVEDQTRVVMENLKAVVEESGACMNCIVKCTIFIQSMDDFPKINEVYGSYFDGIAPARACVEVSRLPKDVLVEVDAVVCVGSGK